MKKMKKRLRLKDEAKGMLGLVLAMTIVSILIYITR